MGFYKHFNTLTEVGMSIIDESSKIEVKMSIIELMVNTALYQSFESIDLLDEFIIHLADYALYLYSKADIRQLLKLRSYCICSDNLSLKHSKYYDGLKVLIDLLLQLSFSAT